MENRIHFEKFLSYDEFHYFLELASNEKVEVMNYGRVFTLEESKEIYEGMLQQSKAHEKFGYFKVLEEISNAFMGLGALTVNDNVTEGEIEYMLLPEYWNKGFGSKIAEKLLRMAEETKSINKVTAIIDPNNAGSKKILLNNGFTLFKTSQNLDNGSPIEIFTKKILHPVL